MRIECAREGCDKLALVPEGWPEGDLPQGFVRIDDKIYCPGHVARCLHRGCDKVTPIESRLYPLPMPGDVSDGGDFVMLGRQLYCRRHALDAALAMLVDLQNRLEILEES
jgi:hypothetical protein